MVKATFTSLLDFDTIDTYYNDDALTLKVEHGHKAIYVDTETHDRIVVEGKDFTYDGDLLVGGTIKDVTFKGSEGGVFATITHAHYDAQHFANVLMQEGVREMLRSAFHRDDVLLGSDARDVLWGAAGDDILRGHRGGDTLEGGKGDDQLAGGAGSDLFIFNHGDGSDRITHFDAEGGGHAQDHIGVHSMDDFSIHKSGDDTVIDFGNGDMITLVDVDRADVSHADFMLL